MFEFRTFSKLDWMGYGGAEPFAEGCDPMIAEGDVVVDGAPEDVILDGAGVSIQWMIDDEPYFVFASGAEGARLLAMLRPAMTYASLAALPRVAIHRA